MEDSGNYRLVQEGSLTVLFTMLRVGQQGVEEVRLLEAAEAAAPASASSGHAKPLEAPQAEAQRPVAPSLSGLGASSSSTRKPATEAAGSSGAPEATGGASSPTAERTTPAATSPAGPVDDDDVDDGDGDEDDGDEDDASDSVLLVPGTVEGSEHVAHKSVSKAVQEAVEDKQASGVARANEADATAKATAEAAAAAVEAARGAHKEAQGGRGITDTLPVTQETRTGPCAADGRRLAADSWQCVGGDESWLLVDRLGDGDTGVRMTREQLADQYGRDQMERLVVAWEGNETFRESFVRAAEDGGDTWTELTHTARQQPRSLAACARLLLLLETSVQEDEMKNSKWADRRKKWCKLVGKAGRGTENSNSIDGPENSVDLLFNAAIEFASAIRPESLTVSFHDGLDNWKERIAMLRTRLVHAMAAACDGSAQRTPKRASRVRPSAATAELITAYFDADAGIQLVHKFCDGLKRWHVED